jgi:dipeptidase
MISVFPRHSSLLKRLPLIVFQGTTHLQNAAGETLSVADPEEAWIFHILPDDTGASAVWVAQRVPDSK